MARPQAEPRRRTFELFAQRSPVTRAALGEMRIGRKSADSLESFLIGHEAVTVANGSWDISSRLGRTIVFSVTREILRGAIVDGNGKILADARRDIAIAPRKGKRMSPTTFSKRITSLATSLVKDDEPGAGPIVGCVVAWPAPISRETGEPTRFEGWSWRGTSLRALFAEALSEPLAKKPNVIVINDADAEALGEAHWGVAQDRKVVLLVKLSGGVGASVVVNGRVFNGAFGESGEIGHMPIAEADGLELKGVQCSCEAEDHLECFASGKVIVENIYRQDRQAQYNELMAELAGRTDEVKVRNVLNNIGAVLGTALIPVAMLTDPDVIVLSSVLWDQGLLESVRTALRRGSVFRVDQREIILGTKTDEAHKMMLHGAGWVAREHFILPTLRSILLA